MAGVFRARQLLDETLFDTIRARSTQYTPHFNWEGRDE